MPDWEVTVVTESNYIKKVTVNDCFTRRDAESQALGSTGAKKVIVSNLLYQSENSDQQNSSYKESVEVHHYHQEENDDDEDYYKQLDESEIEMYDLMCQIAMEKGEELPTIQEFYDYLNS